MEYVQLLTAIVGAGFSVWMVRDVRRDRHFVLQQRWNGHLELLTRERLRFTSGILFLQIILVVSAVYMLATLPHEVSPTLKLWEYITAARGTAISSILMIATIYQRKIRSRLYAIDNASTSGQVKRSASPPTFRTGSDQGHF